MPCSAKIVARLLEQVARISSALDGMQPTFRQVPPRVGALLDAGHLHAELGGADRRHVAARAGADHDEVEGIVCHRSSQSPSAGSERLRSGEVHARARERVAPSASLDVEQQALGILDAFLDPHQEHHGLAAVDDAVVVATARGTSSAGPRPGRRRTTGRCWILCMPRMPLCGGLRIGVDISEPKTPPLEIVKVPPVRSSIVELAVARLAGRARRSPSRSRRTTMRVGVAHAPARPGRCGVPTATPMS